MTKEKNDKGFNFGAYAFRQFRRNKPAYISLYILGFLALMALLAPVIANERPLFISYKGHLLYPALSFKKNYILTNDDGTKETIQLDIADWKQMKADKVVWAPIPYAPEKTDMLNAGYKGPHDAQLFKNSDGQIINMPSRFRHVMGTNSLGEDVASGLIHGARVSLTIGFIAMAIASVLGLILGSMAGYFGDSRLRTSRGQFWMVALGIIAGWFYGFQTRQFNLQDALSTGTGKLIMQLLFSISIAIAVTVIFALIGRFLGKLPFLNKQVNIPVDSIVSRTIEIFHSMPTFILILTIAAIARPSMTNVMIIIGFTSWTGIARLTRAELLRIRQLEYIQAARALGFGELKIILRHALPNGIAPALVSIAFGIASAVLIESSLSFLGIGVPSDVVTWGSLVNDGRQQYSAWWLVVFPGVAIFLTVTVYNLIGEGLRDALDPKHKK